MRALCLLFFSLIILVMAIHTPEDTGGRFNKALSWIATSSHLLIVILSSIYFLGISFGLYIIYSLLQITSSKTANISNVASTSSSNEIKQEQILGDLLSSHRRALFYPIAILFVVAPTVYAGVIFASEGNMAMGLMIIFTAILLYGCYLAITGSQRLEIYKNGIHKKNFLGTEVIFWSQIDNVLIFRSYGFVPYNALEYKMQLLDGSVKRVRCHCTNNYILIDNLLEQLKRNNIHIQYV